MTRSTARRAAACALVAGVVTSLALASCAEREPRVHHVEIRAMQFVPAELVVDVGDVVVWTNHDVVPHTVTAAGRFDSQQLASQATWRYVAAGTGAIAYTCTYHPTMNATLIVR